MKKHYLKIILASALLIACESPQLASNNKASSKTNSYSSNQFQQKFLQVVNQVRARARKCGEKYFPAAAALELNNNLNEAAYMHSLDMSKHQFLEHTSSNGDTLVERIQDANYAWRAIGENIAFNQNSIEQVIQDWLSSPGHCSNMMSADYTQTGVANVNRYWTQVYAAPK